MLSIYTICFIVIIVILVLRSNRVTVALALALCICTYASRLHSHLHYVFALRTCIFRSFFAPTFRTLQFQVCSQEVDCNVYETFAQKLNAKCKCNCKYKVQV